MKHLSKRILSTLCVVPVAFATAQIASPAPSPSAALVPTTSGSLVPTTDVSIVPTAPGATPPSTVPLVPPVAPAPSDAAAPAPEQPAPIEPPMQDANPVVTAPGDPAAPVVPGAPAVGAPGAANINTYTAPNDGHPVTEFQDQEIATAVRLLARQAKISVSISDKVVGTLTIRLEDKTPLEAIRIICTAKGLYLDNIEGVYFVKTMDEKAREPTTSEFYTFSYAQAKDMAPLLASQFSEAGPQTDSRTNTVFYRITKSNAESAKLFLSTVDKPTKQVMIEARLVEVNANPKQSYGINWAGALGGAASPKTIRYGGSTLASSSIQTSTNPTTGAQTNTIVPSTLPSVVTNTSSGNFTPQDFLFNNLQSLGSQFSILSLPQLSLTLRLLNEDSDAEFLANPRVVTANNEKATIKITRNQPVPQLNFNEQTATAVFGGFEDKTYGNTLEVTPSINKDDFVTLAVKPTISNKVADATFTFSGATVASPVIDTRTLDSNVLIKSGNTLAIGGLLQDEVTKGRTKVPVLGDIPVLGYMFQERLNSRTKRNLLVFVTPTIIKEGYGTGLEDQVNGLHDVGEEYADPNGWRNNAKGAVRAVPTSNRQVAADYPAPGTPMKPISYRTQTAARDR